MSKQNKERRQKTKRLKEQKAAMRRWLELKKGEVFDITDWATGLTLYIPIDDETIPYIINDVIDFDQPLALKNPIGS